VGSLLESHYGLPALVALAAYLLGSIPFGLILTRAAGLGDVRAIGSGNIGATNVLRTGNKGVAAVLLVRHLIGGDRLELLEPLAAAAALVGHCYPIWLGFKGGKGVATFFGIAFALWWPIGLAAAAAWIAGVAVTRYSSVGGLAAANVAAVAAAILGRFDLAFFFLGVSFLIDWKHRANIARLASGTEPKIGRKQPA
jgi:acyl phosphate:glycerol-3-phosphate acyltransferase